MHPHSRREFVQLALAALPAAGLLSIPSHLAAAEASAKPDSKVAGVQLGVSGVELRTQPVELFLGAPKDLVYPPKKDKNAPKTDAAPPTTTLKDWRKSASMGRAKEFRTKWENAGVLIEIVKVDGIFKMSDEEQIGRAHV